MPLSLARDQKDQRRDQESSARGNEQITVPRQMRKNVQRSFGRADGDPLHHTNQFIEGDGSAAGHEANDTRQNDERKGLDLIDLFTKALEQWGKGRGRIFGLS